MKGFRREGKTALNSHRNLAGAPQESDNCEDSGDGDEDDSDQEHPLLKTINTHTFPFQYSISL